ncbi:MAG: cysteine desulfurase family protein [Gammaproteobacteria bacterium]
MSAQIYLDYNASTPVAPAAVAAMREAAEMAFGNPSSPHWAGRPAHASVARARERVAALLGCTPDEIVFTSGGTEANNFVIKGTYFSHAPAPVHIVTSAVEHPATVEPCRFLERLGASVTWLPVDGVGRVDPDDLRRAMRADTRLVTIMHANNEVGTLQPIAECAAVARERGVPFHTDAAQSLGKLDARVDALGVDMLSLAGHKLYAPKGVGALYLRAGCSLSPLMHGAGHEQGRRAGTEATPLLAALGAAADYVADLGPMTAVRARRDRFHQALAARFGEGMRVNGDLDGGLPNTLNVSFVGQRGGELLARLDFLAASTGSACHAGRVELSPVLAAMGVSPEAGAGAIRFSLGRDTTDAEIDTVVAALARLVT